MNLTPKQQQFLDKFTIDAKMQKAPLNTKVEQVIKVTSISCAAFALMPIPGSDSLVLTVIECSMVIKIGHLYGFKITKERAYELLFELVGVLGIAWLGKHSMLWGYKTFIPYWGGFFTVPMVFGVCYGMGKVADLYFKNKTANEPFNREKAKQIFQETKEKAKLFIKNHPLDKNTAKELFELVKKETEDLAEYVKSKMKLENMTEKGKNAAVLLGQKAKSGAKSLLSTIKGNKDKFFSKKKKIETDDFSTAFFALQTRHLQTLDNLDSEKTELILDAIRRSTTSLPDDASREEIAEYVQQYSPEQKPGMVSNISGIYHELTFQQQENNDGDEIKAQLFEQTNHPGSDAILINTHTGEREFVQLKATDSTSYIEKAIEKNPDIRIISTEEMAEKLGIESSGMSNAELREDVAQTLDNLSESEYQDLTSQLPTMSFWVTAFAVGPIFLQYLKKEISKEECLARAGNLAGKKLAKYICFLLLLSCPMTNLPTAAYLIIRCCFVVIKAYRLN